MSEFLTSVLSLAWFHMVYIAKNTTLSAATFAVALAWSGIFSLWRRPHQWNVGRR